MSKRNVGAMVMGCVVIAAGIASCSFPTYNITVTGGTGGATASASETASSGSIGGAGGASVSGSSNASSSATSSGSVGGAGGASASASSGAGGTGGSGGTTSASSGSSTSAGSTSASSSSGGPCSTDADGDTYVSVKCPGGNDCADDDVLANPTGTYHAFPINNPPVGTLPFDFNCNGAEESETPSLQNCNACQGGQGFQGTVACGASAPLGKCVGLAICSFQALSPAMNKQQRCR